MLENCKQKQKKKLTKDLTKIWNRFEKEIKKNIAFGYDLTNPEFNEKIKKIKDKNIKNDKLHDNLFEILNQYNSRLVINQKYKINESDFKKLAKFGSSKSDIINIWKKMDSAEVAKFENTQKRTIELCAVDFLQSLRSKDKQFCKYPPSQYYLKVTELISIYEKYILIKSKIEENNTNIDNLKSSSILMTSAIEKKELENKKLEEQLVEIESSILTFYWILTHEHFDDVIKVLFDETIDISEMEQECESYENNLYYAYYLESIFRDLSNYDEAKKIYENMLKFYIGKPVFYEAFNWIKEYKESRENIYEDQLKSGEIGQYLLGFKTKIKLESVQMEFYHELCNLYDTENVFKTIFVSWPTGLGKSWLSNMLPIIYPNKKILFVTPNDILTFDCSQQQLKNQRGVDYVGCVMEAGRFPRFDKTGEVLEDYTDFLKSQRITCVSASRIGRYISYLSNFDIIILDEGHCADHYPAYTNLLKMYPETHFIILSATINIDKSTEFWFKHIRNKSIIIYNKRSKRPIPLSSFISQKSSDINSPNTFQLKQLNPLTRIDPRNISEELIEDINFAPSDKDYLQLYNWLKTNRGITDEDSYTNRDGVTRKIKMELFFEGIKKIGTIGL